MLDVYGGAYNTPLYLYESGGDFVSKNNVFSAKFTFFSL
jgi:hypothetical protein